MKQRLDYISWIQFIGVLCVIFGHSMNDIAVPGLLKDIKAWIYVFHMPLFFLVSGYLFSYTGGFEHKGGYWGTLKGKISRLLIPYIIWNVLFIFPKIMMADYITDQVELTPGYFGMLMLYPRNNILGHTWFLFALFEMFIIAIAFEKWKKNKLLWIPVACVLIVLNCFGVTERFLALGDLMKNGIYFWAGLLLGNVEVEKLKQIAIDKSLVLWGTAIIVGCTVVWTFTHEGFESSMPVNALLLGMTVILMLGVLQIKLGISGRFIEFVSRNSFAIYIMHWPILMVIRLIVYQKMHLAPIPTMFIMFVGGLAIACGLAWLFRQFKSPFMKGFNKVVLGM